MITGKNLIITKDNIIENKNSLYHLCKHFNYLVKNLKRYPLICEFCNFRFVLEDVAELVQLILILNRNIIKFEEG